ncbi:helix-turn-helix domain-containing protein, partial [Liquorilactobacillus ghanensis]|uniref:helix-turn-helix domain-containing protein n=4 Tax=Liquorilactobacillus ghanensis TaxID=399370 RepID=UPI0039E8A89B
VIHYKAEANSKLIQGSTFFIKNSKEDLIGLLCINFDSGTYINMAETLLKFAPIPLSINYQQKNTNTTSEILHTNIEDVIYSIINPSLLKSDISLSQEKKIQICSKLNDRGIFQIKGAISKVAKLLKVSEPSVYRYLKIINEKKQ